MPSSQTLPEAGSQGVCVTSACWGEGKAGPRSRDSLVGELVTSFLPDPSLFLAEGASVHIHGRSLSSSGPWLWLIPAGRFPTHTYPKFL